MYHLWQPMIPYTFTLGGHPLWRFERHNDIWCLQKHLFGHMQLLLDFRIKRDLLKNSFWCQSALCCLYSGIYCSFSVNGSIYPPRRAAFIQYNPLSHDTIEPLNETIPCTYFQYYDNIQEEDAWLVIFIWCDLMRFSYNPQHSNHWNNIITDVGLSTPNMTILPYTGDDIFFVWTLLFSQIRSIWRWQSKVILTEYLSFILQQLSPFIKFYRYKC